MMYIRNTSPYFTLPCDNDRYKLDEEEVWSAMDRVTAVPGDLSRPLLGLDDTAFKVSGYPSSGREGCLSSFTISAVPCALSVSRKIGNDRMAE